MNVIGIVCIVWLLGGLSAAHILHTLIKRDR